MVVIHLIATSHTYFEDTSQQYQESHQLRKKADLEVPPAFRLCDLWSLFTNRTYQMQICSNVRNAPWHAGNLKVQLSS